MRICKVCGSTLEETQKVCPYCNTVYKEDSKPKASTLPKTKAADTIQKFAEFMDDELMLKAAECKMKGIGVEKNEEEAIELLRLLAYRGNLEGMYKYALILEGNGDSDEALKWLSLAAKAGHKPSIIKLQLGNKNIPIPDIKYNFKDTNNIVTGTFADVVKAAMPNIVMIEAVGRDGSKEYHFLGSGFIIEGNYVITNAHVVGKDPHKITVRFEASIDEKEYVVKPVYIERGYDLAVLEFTGLAKERIEAFEHFSLNLDPQYGQDAYTIGNPKGFDFSVSKCVVSNPNRQYDFNSVTEVIQVDMTVNHGNSGGALLDMNNNVLGVITFYPTGINGGISMCVPAKYIVKVLNKI